MYLIFWHEFPSVTTPNSSGWVGVITVIFVLVLMLLLCMLEFLVQLLKFINFCFSCELALPLQWAVSRQWGRSECFSFSEFLFWSTILLKLVALHMLWGVCMHPCLLHYIQCFSFMRRFVEICSLNETIFMLPKSETLQSLVLFIILISQKRYFKLVKGIRASEHSAVLTHHWVHAGLANS